MDEAECRTRLASTPVGRLATIRPDGRVDLVPIVFALIDDDLVFAVDHKPKRTTKLQRLANISTNPEVCALFDHYDDDWTTLWWVRMRGQAVVVPGGPATARALDALQARHPQYAERRPQGPVVWITPTEWTGWGADEVR
jgi:PPOX class probable F420-dependent enzyme